MPGLPKVPAAEKVDVDENGRISLSMKAIQPEEEPQEVFDYKEKGEATTGLGALLKGIKF